MGEGGRRGVWEEKYCIFVKLCMCISLLWGYGKVILLRNHYD